MKRPRDHAGLTLLETLLALTTLAALAALAAALLAQTRSWAAETGLASDALEQTHIVSLVREQLQQRVPTGESTSSDKPVSMIAPDALWMYTAEGALLVNAPIVRAEYRIDREAQSRLVGASASLRASLMLIERRVLDVRSPDAGFDLGVVAPVFDQQRERTLLKDCARLEFQALERSQQQQQQQLSAPTWISFAAHLETTMETEQGVDAPDNAMVNTDAQRSAPAPAAIRLVGVCDDEEFVWVF